MSSALAHASTSNDDVAAGTTLDAAQRGAEPARNIRQKLLHDYENMIATTGSDAASMFLLEAARSKLKEPDDIRYLVRSPNIAENQFLVNNLKLIYLNLGGVDKNIYSDMIMMFVELGNPERVLSVYRNYLKVGEASDFEDTIIFNIATCMQSFHKPQEAFDLYISIINNPKYYADCNDNIHYLAKQFKLVDAHAYLSNKANSLFINYDIEKYARYSEIEIDFQSMSFVSNVIGSLRSSGFCIIRQGLDSKILQEMADCLLGSDIQIYTDRIDERHQSMLGAAWRFDAPALMKAIFLTPPRLDFAVSAVRRVAPDQQQTFTPFHQDVTAFGKALVNIWAPLTPAGGAYPTIQLVRKYITKSEQTILSDGEYSAVEIAESSVLEKYGDLLYTVEQASPGDCVIFLGSTIHRTVNVSKATEVRYNLEIRWS